MNPTSQTSDFYRKTILSLKGAVYTRSMCTCVWRYGRYFWLQHRDKGSCSFGTNGRVKTNTQENNQNWWKISGKNKNLIGDHVNVWIIFWNFYFFFGNFFWKIYLDIWIHISVWKMDIWIHISVWKLARENPRRIRFRWGFGSNFVEGLSSHQINVANHRLEV